MNYEAFRNDLLTKFNTRAFSMLTAIMLTVGGIAMCFSQLNQTGEINIKAAFVEGKIQTGSLGLMTVFFGVMIVLAMNLNRPYKGQEIRILLDGKEVSGKGLSYRKVRELMAVITEAEKAGADKTPDGSP